MKAIVVEDSEHGKTLRLAEVEPPSPSSTELLVRVRAAGLNRSDLSRTLKHYSPRDIHIAGNEMSGEVVAVGASVNGFGVGDRVMALAYGSYAEFACVDHRLAMRVPPAMSWEAAAAVPANYLTAHDALSRAGQLARGGAVLVHAVTSGVGIAAVQVARQLGAGRVLGTTRNVAKAEPLQKLGLDVAIDVSGVRAFAERVMAETGGDGAAVILDLVGEGMMAENLKAASLQGTVVVAGLMGGSSDAIDLDQLVFRRIQLVGVTFRSRSLAEREAVCRRFVDEMGDRLADGTLSPLVFRAFPLEAASQAQDLMRSNAHLGKIVLLP